MPSSSLSRRVSSLALVVVAAGGCAPTTLEPEPWPVLDPRYPAAQLDYAPLPALAHAAMPIYDEASARFVGRGRVWVKGTAGLCVVTCGDEPPVELDPPHYTAVVEADPGTVEVRFTGDVPGLRYRTTVTVPDAQELVAPRERMSLLSFGCFDPFWIDDGEPVVNGGGDDRSLVRIRELLLDAALGDLDGLPAPSVILGVGDQIYTEPAHDAWSEYGLGHPLSAWTIEEKPRPRVGLARFVEFLDDTYRHHWSFTSLDEALRSCPSVMIWDDHEIRDGWGSQGDEHVYLDTYYAAARKAFLDHQMLRGPRVVPVDAPPRAPLHQAMRVHGLPVFVMDERSARDVSVPAVLGREQWDALRRWIAGLRVEESPFFVIASPLPILYRVADIVGIAEEFDAEVTDDLLDNWSSDVNVDELDELVGELLRAWDRGLRPIVISGDMHISALLRATVTDDDGRERVFAYEIVTSGLAGPLDGGGWKHALGREGALVPGAVDVDGRSVTATMAATQSRPNFGGVEIEDGRAFAHLVQALPEGPVHYRVPLAWDEVAEPLGTTVQRGRRELARDRGAVR